MAKFRKKPVIIAATQWFRNGDHPMDACEMVHPDPNFTTQFEPFPSEGKVVRRHRLSGGGQAQCAHCGGIMYKHGWIDTLEGGHIVCPGDYIITGVKGEHYPCKPDIFEMTYEPAGESNG
jgi:hypothetical protein